MHSGYICVSLPAACLAELNIPMMVPHNEDQHSTAYTLTVDYRHRTTTGISAHDRALTVRALAAASSSTPESGVTAASFARPGHMMPLRAETRRGAYSSKTARTCCRATSSPFRRCGTRRVSPLDR